MEKDTCVKFYIRNNCHSSKKARRFLEEYKIPHEVFHLESDLTSEIIRFILKYSVNGTKDIVKKTIDDYEDLGLDSFIDKALNNPTILKSPILVKGDKVAIGFNEEVMSVFLPRDVKIANYQDYLFMLKQNE